MKCPSCHETAISLFNWGKGLKWYKTDCVACGQKLKAAPITIFLFVLSIALGLAGIFLSKIFFKINEPYNFVLGFFIIAVVALISYFKTDGYKAVE